MGNISKTFAGCRAPGKVGNDSDLVHCMAAIRSTWVLMKHRPLLLVFTLWFTVQAHGNQLTRLPRQMLVMERLQVVDLSRNRLCNLCPELFTLPLTSLSLQHNDLAALPEDLGGLITLEVNNPREVQETETMSRKICKNRTGGRNILMVPFTERHSFFARLS